MSQNFLPNTTCSDLFLLLAFHADCDADAMNAVVKKKVYIGIEWAEQVWKANLWYELHSNQSFPFLNWNHAIHDIVHFFIIKLWETLLLAKLISTVCLLHRHSFISQLLHVSILLGGKKCKDWYWDKGPSGSLQKAYWKPSFRFEVQKWARKKVN